MERLPLSSLVCRMVGGSSLPSLPPLGPSGPLLEWPDSYLASPRLLQALQGPLSSLPLLSSFSFTLSLFSFYFCLSSQLWCLHDLCGFHRLCLVACSLVVPLRSSYVTRSSWASAPMLLGLLFLWSFRCLEGQGDLSVGAAE